MDTALVILVIVPILFAAAAAVRHLVRSVLAEGFSRQGRSTLDLAYAERLLRQEPAYPSLPDDLRAAMPDPRRQRLA